MTVPNRQPRSVAIVQPGGLRLALCLSVAMSALWLAATPAHAQTTTTTTTTSGATSPSSTTAPGCNPAVMEAAQRVADAKVAAERANIDQNTPQPPSVLMSTCNNQAAGVAASQGGNIFSGDFMSDIQPIVGSALGSLYSNFDSSISSFFSSALGSSSAGSAASGAIGSALGSLLGSAFGSGASSLQNNYDCQAMSDTWSAVQNRGVAGGTSISGLNQLISGTAPSGAGQAFTKAWQAAASNGIFSNAQTAVNNLPRPGNIPSYAPGDTVCDVLRKAGNSPQGCN